MIGLVEGSLVRIEQGRVLVLTAGGTGYNIQVPPGMLSDMEEGQSVRLMTEMVVRESDMTLFGFLNPLQHDVFRVLTSVPGVGGKMGLSVLGLGVHAVCEAIECGNADFLSQAVGVGKKMAQRICQEALKAVSTLPYQESPQRASERDALTKQAAVIETASVILKNMGLEESDFKTLLSEAAPQGGDVNAIVGVVLRELGGQDRAA